MAWVEKQIADQGGKIEAPVRLILDAEAQARYFDWRNSLHALRGTLPAPLRGFLPKAYEYALRLTGAIHCIRVFSRGGTPKPVLNVEDLDRGIRAVTFYLGQVQAALRLIEDRDFVPIEISERSLLLARTLDALRPQLDSGRLAVGFIHERYNHAAPKGHKIGSARAMGALLRDADLTVPPVKNDANGRRRVYCLEWDAKVEKFIQECLQSLQSHQSQEWCWSEDGDIGETKSPESAKPEGDEFFGDFEDDENAMSAHETLASSGDGDMGDFGDIMEVEI
jgi:hypothetical protein